jgi:hypothetical protein
MHTWKIGENDPNLEFFFKRQPVYQITPQRRNKTGIQFGKAQIPQPHCGVAAPLASLMVMTT